MKRILAAFVVLVILLMLAVAWVVLPIRARLPHPVFVDIPHGAGTRQIAGLLAENGVIDQPAEFWLVRLVRPRAKLKAGEYQFKQPASAWQVFDRIVRGDIFYYVLVVPEGSNTFDIGAALERQKIMPPAAFLAAARDPSPVRDLDPKAPTLEGYLFPDTYHLSRHVTAAQLCRLMTARFRKAWAELGPLKADVHDTVTLASMIEREAKLPAERPLIASVFANRLRLGMALQCDPTIIYAALLEDRYRGVIHRSDLENHQAYNTYQHPGLPPGPISNPGRASLEAALKPAQSDYLYFVKRADGSGAHQFSTELAGHARAVQQYRRGEQANGVTRVR